MVKSFVLGIVGSYSTNTHVPCSDIDIACIGMFRPKIKPRYFDIYSMRVDKFIDGIVRHEKNRSLYSLIQWLYPYRFCKSFPLSECFIDMRNDVVKAIHPYIYKSFFNSGEHFREMGLCGGSGRGNKFIVQSILKYSTIANYAEGMPFAQAHRPEGELHDFLIGIRLGRIPIEDAIARIELERVRAEKTAGFYKEAIHAEILCDFEYVIRQQT